MIDLGKFLEKLNNKPISKKITKNSITCNCHNCGQDFQKCQKTYNHHQKHKLKYFFCNNKCYFEFKKCKKINVICSQCSNNIELRLSKHEYSIKTGLKNFFCNHECHGNFLSKKVKFNCFNCDKELERAPWETRENNFCSKQCWYKHNKAVRSKLELYLEEKIKNYFPYLPYVCCDRTICRNLELDFYFPDLKLAIEINGIFHYEPIFGEEKLNYVQHNDKGKNYLCKQQGIKLLTLKSIENFTQFGIKERDWNIFKNMIISELPYCETESDLL